MTGSGEGSDDLAAIARVLRGESEAFSDIVGRYHRLVFRLASSYLPTAADAEDATQEVFVKAFRALPRFPAREPLPTVALLDRRKPSEQLIPSITTTR